MPNELKPCPFCGGKAIPQEMERTPEKTRIIIGCMGCGVTVEITQHISTHQKIDPISREIVGCDIVKHTPDVFDIWNRRVDND